VIEKQQKLLLFVDPTSMAKLVKSGNNESNLLAAFARTLVFLVFGNDFIFILHVFPFGAYLPATTH
jgi:hypothetical protein